MSSYLIVGLGNPGKEYTFTRHNMGFLVAQRMADLCQWKFARSQKYQGYWAQGEIENHQVHLLLPTTYMNHSGVSVAAFLGQREISLMNILVICDDFHLPFGELRFRAKGSAGGHNGLASVLQSLKTRDIPRLRIGIDNAPDQACITDFVLSEFRTVERRQLDEILDRAVVGCRSFIAAGISHVMAEFNKKSKKEDIRR